MNRTVLVVILIFASKVFADGTSRCTTSIEGQSYELKINIYCSECEFEHKGVQVKSQSNTVPCEQMQMRDKVLKRGRVMQANVDVVCAGFPMTFLNCRIVDFK